MSDRQKRKGPPSRFTEETKRRVCDALLLGCTYSLAASHAGISESTLFRWLSCGREEEEGEFADFYRRAKEAEALSAVRNLATIVQAAKAGQWTAAAWLLERRHGYVREPDRPTVEMTIEIQNTDVVSLIEEIQEHNLEELLTGPTIDIEEE